MAIIGNIKLSKNIAKIGECICIEVFDVNDKSLENNRDIDVRINGIPGAKQYKQFEKFGKRIISVQAANKNKEYDYKKTELEIIEEYSDIPILETLLREYTSTVIDFKLVSARKGNNLAEFILKKHYLENRPIINKNKPRKPKEVEKIKFDRKTVISWDFGDGKVKSGRGFMMSFDYLDKLDFRKDRTFFHVTATINMPGEQRPVVIKKTISILNHYYIAKKKGFLQPYIETSLNAVPYEEKAINFFSAINFISKQFNPPNKFECTISVKNVERESLLITNYRVEEFFENPEIPSKLSPVFDTNYKLASNKKSILRIILGKPEISLQSVSFGVHFYGVSTKTRMPVSFSAYYDMPERRRGKPIFNSEDLKKLVELLRKNKLIDPYKIDGLQLREIIKGPLPVELQYSKAIQKFKNFVFTQSATVRSGSGGIIEGKECDPYNLPDNIPDGMFCMATKEYEWRWVPALFLNARKGDIILSPGSSSGMIAKVLRSLSPSQYYSHCGLITRTQTEVTHSTAAEERLAEFITTDGFIKNALKYLYPGVIRQETGNSVEGEFFNDPEDPDKGPYKIVGFNPNYDKKESGEIVPARVVKPHPYKETFEIRNFLYKIGDFARTQHLKSHYRFYSYTNPDIANNSGMFAPILPEWCKNTYPTICSSFVWYCVNKIVSQQKLNLRFEMPQLEPDDINSGAEISSGAKDGLYFYHADERRNAGHVIYNEIYNKCIIGINEKGGDLGELIANGILDIADDCANQVCNAFASDWVDDDSPNSTEWQQTGSANAVSPDNLLMWDEPPTFLYGYSEPLIYRPSRWENVPVYKWKKVKGFGKISGNVVFENKVVGGAMIFVRNYPDCSANSDEFGKFTLEYVPEGNCIVEAIRTNQDGTTWKTPQGIPINVIKNKDNILNIVLDGPNPDYREVEIDVDMIVFDHEINSASGGHREYESWTSVVKVNTSHPTAFSGPFPLVADGDVLGEGRITTERCPDRTVNIVVYARLYDGVDPENDPYWESSLPFKVAEGGTESHSIKVACGDYVKVSVTVKNKVDQAS